MKGSVVEDYAVTLCSKISEFRRNDVYSDVDFRVHGKSFKCHRLVLGAASEYFHVMFTSKFKESTESVVTLEEVAADTFEAVLQFIYSGDVSITPTSNLYELFYASDFYKLPGLEEICVSHIREYTSLLVESVLQLYSFFHATSKENVIKILDKSILDHFGDFSQTSEFLKISIDDLSRILNQLGDSSASNHDIFHKAIIKWTNYAVSHSPEEKRQYSEKLIKNIDCRKLSGQYLVYMTKWHIEHSNTVSSTVKVSEITHSKADDEISFVEPCFHAFANNHPTISRDLVQSQVYSCYDEFEDECTWIHSYSFKHRLPDFMRTVEVNNDLYCLSFANNVIGKQETTENSTQNKFIATSSVSLCPKSSLTSPPLILQNFEMCRMQGNIYVYNKNALSTVVRNVENSASFDEEALARAVYLYNTETNLWLPIPPLKQKFANACMTCDDQMVYLIGGTNSNKYVQGYDYRTSEWIALAPTSGIFERAACCVSGEDVYVSGGCHNPKKVESYDPTAAKWKNKPDMREGLLDHEMLADEYDNCVTYNKFLKLDESNVFTIDGEWDSCMYDDLVKSIELYDAEVIHMTLFKPYGF